MDLRLQYTEGRSDGVFGWMLPADAPPEGDTKPVCVLVTHAYKEPDGTYRPKVKSGTYICQRGPHRLHGMTEDFETFEVLGVKGHKGILFHWGNYGSASEGCFCVGRKIVLTDQDRDGVDGPDEMVTSSRDTFAAFMKLQEGMDTFRLVVEDNFSTGEIK